MIRKSAVLFFAWLFAASAVVMGQTSQDPRIGTSPETTSDGHVYFKVENLSALPITAMVAVGTRTPLSGTGTQGTSVRYFDSVINSHIRSYNALMPHQTYTFSFFGPRPAQVRKEVTLKAAIFADGTTYGDTDWISKLIDARRAMLADLEEGISMLQTARSSGETGEELIKNAESVKAARYQSKLTREEKMAAGQVYGNIAWSLKSDSQMPSDAHPLTASQRIDELTSRFQQQQLQLINSKPTLVATPATSASATNR